MSFADKVVKSRDHLIRLVTGESKGKAAWWYLRVKHDLYEKYKIALRTDPINLEDFGEILFRGWGTEPPEDIKKRIEEEY